MKNLQLFVLLGAAALSGCAGLMLRERDVLFENPYQRLGIQEVQPNEAEKSGVVLRYNPAPAGLRRAREEDLVYAEIKGNRGKEIRLVENQIERFSPGSRKDSYVLLTETTFEGDSGRLLDEQEVTTRGEIFRFIRGIHESKLGSFRIVDWKRAPALPERPVKIGDAWNYEESMDVRLDSWLAKEKDPQPYKIKAACALTGFALVKGKRAAIVKIHATQKKRELLKILFKELALDLNIDIEEIDYFDYVSGVVIAKITRSRSISAAPDYAYMEEEQGQSVYYVQ